jgi:hypothetical protein
MIIQTLLAYFTFSKSSYLKKIKLNDNSKVFVVVFKDSPENKTKESPNLPTTQTSSSSITPSLSAPSYKLHFKNRIARELPICTVSVDHEDGDLISFNRQCLHVYYATIRLLCMQSRAYTREISTHSNFQWALKHIMPYSMHYPLVAQELNKCLYLFLHQKPLGLKKYLINKKHSQTLSNSENNNDNDDDYIVENNEINSEEEEEGEGEEDQDEDEKEEEEEIKKTKLQLKEMVATILLVNPEVETKQCWQSIILGMKTIIETLEDATIVLTRRGLSVLSFCFFNISIIHNHSIYNGQQQQQQQQQNDSSLDNFNSDLCDCMRILMQLCEAVKHHMDKFYSKKSINISNDAPIRQLLTSWKEKNELCKRILMLINFNNTNEVKLNEFIFFSTKNLKFSKLLKVRTRALDVLQMILAVVPNDTFQFVIQFIFTSYFPSTSATASNSTLNHSQIYNNLYSNKSNSVFCQKAMNIGNQTFKKNDELLINGTTPLVCCESPYELRSQALQFMGTHFPIVVQNSNKNNKTDNLIKNQISNATSKPIFNMFIPLLFIPHSHINDAIVFHSKSANVSRLVNCVSSLN